MTEVTQRVTFLCWFSVAKLYINTRINWCGVSVWTSFASCVIVFDRRTAEKSKTDQSRCVFSKDMEVA